MANDCYSTIEHRVCADGHIRPAGKVFGNDGITRPYFARYRLPVRHTETNHIEGPTGQEAAQGETPQPSTQSS